MKGGWRSGRERARASGGAATHLKTSRQRRWDHVTPTSAGSILHAGLVVRAGQRDRLAQVCRYALRPPLAQERLHRTSEGEIWLTLRHRWADGTTHLRFDPLELLERLAVLTPRPRVNLVLYYGVLAPRAAWRAALVPATSHDMVVSEGGPRWSLTRTPVARYHPGRVGISGPS